MKIFRLTVFLLLTAASWFAALGQVDNYALEFSDGEGVVNLGRVSELADAQDYTLQLWFCPAEWTQGACLVRCGSFSIKLGVEHALVVNDGVHHFSLTTSAVGVGRWSHLTLRCGSEGTVATIDNAQRFVSEKPITLPAAEKSLWLGGGFKGRIDEVRLWQGRLSEAYNSFWQNTLNDLIPSRETLLAYWKLDQEQCEHVVDYCGVHHGTLSGEGVAKVKVGDNDRFRYRISLAYGDIARFFDRKIDARHYSLSNRIAVIGGHFNPYTNTHYLAMEREDADLGDGVWLADADGHSGVVRLDGGEGLRAPGTVLEVGSAPKEQRSAPAGYAFEAWLRLDEITPGATLFAKGDMAVTLTAEGTLSVALGGQSLASKAVVPTGQWTHVGVSAANTTVIVTIDDASETLTAASAFAPLMDASQPVIGRGVKGLLDDVVIWAAARTADEMKADAQRVPLADAEHAIAGNSAAKMAACYMFDNETEPGYDSFSVDQCFRTMRSYTAGMRGVKFFLSLGANGFQNCLVNASLREKLGEKLARMVDDDLYDGLDLDFEWPENATQWTNVALLCQVIRQHLKDGKELSVSPHYSYYLFPQARMNDVDFFNFQIYGPNNPTLFTREGYSAAVGNFRRQGFPDDKIVMSYASTTSGGYNENGARVANTHKGFSPVGYAGLTANAEGGVPADATRAYHQGNGCWYYLTAFDQTVWRAQYVVENGLGGIMYWDMGNDLPASHTLSLARGASYALNANVEPLVTSVASAAPAPADDEYAPADTEDPADQGGFDATEAQEAISTALEVYARTAGYPAAGSDERTRLLAAVNRAHTGQADGASVASATADYLTSQPAAVGGPRDGAVYNVVSVNSYDGSRRYLYVQADGTVNVTYNPENTADEKYRWTIKVREDGTFILVNADGRYLTADAMAGGEAAAYGFAVVPGLKVGLLMLQRSSDNWYLNTHYNEANVAGEMVTAFSSAASEGDNPKKWSAQWFFEEINPQLLAPYAVVANDERGGVKTSDGIVLTDGATYYIDPEAASDLAAMPTEMTHGRVAFDHAAKTIGVSYFGLFVRKAYRLLNNNRNHYLTITDEKELKGLADADEADPQQIFMVTRMSDTKFSLQAQGIYVGAPMGQSVNVVASETPVDFYVVHRESDDCYAFDQVKPNGGTWADGSKALMCNADGAIIPWGTGTADAWWKAEEVSEYVLNMQRIGTEYYAAVCLPFSFTLPDDVIACDVELSGTAAALRKLDIRDVAPQTPVLLVGSAPTATLTIAPSESVATTSLQGNLFAQATAPSGTYVLSSFNGTPAFVQTTSLPRNIAYLTAPDETATIIPLEEVKTPVAIDNVGAQTPSAPAAVYDLQGRKNNEPAKGINIINGQKIIVR